MPSVKIKVGYVKTGIKKREIFCETWKSASDNLLFRFSFDGHNVPKFLFKEWAYDKMLEKFYIDKMQEQWYDYYNQLKRNPLITLSYQSFEGVIEDCVLEAL